jgi:hypothetical protein
VKPAILSGSNWGTEQARELYAPGDAFHAFFEAGSVVGFEVGNFDDARRAMIFIGGVQRGGGVAWQHFQGPDGTILEIIGPSAVDRRAPA